MIYDIDLQNPIFILITNKLLEKQIDSNDNLIKTNFFSFNLQETYSDEKPKNPTLSDLGVKLSYIEDKWPDHLAIWRWEWSYEGDVGEKKLFKNPPYIIDQ